MEKTFIHRLIGGNPFIWVKSHERDRVLGHYVHQITTAKVKNSSGKTENYHAYTWDVADGLRKASVTNGVISFSEPIPETGADPLIPIDWLAKNETPENTVLFLKDYHPFLKDTYPLSTVVISKIRNFNTKAKGLGKALVVLSPLVNIPLELEKESPMVTFKLPDRTELKVVLQTASESSGIAYPKDDEPVLDAALGLTATEAESAFFLALAETKSFDPTVVRREKAELVKKNGNMEVVDTTNFVLDDIGGQENLKQWLIDRKGNFTEKARKFGIKPPKGILLLGPAGTGKSLMAKAVASAWGRPCLRLDLGSIKDKWVGGTEHNITAALALAEAVSPCILWIDEIEKAMPSTKGGDAHETSKSLLQIILTWMTEHKSDVFIVATANAVHMLDEALIRPGRIDARFWIDLPDAIQRAEILRIHLRKSGRKPGIFNARMDELTEASKMFSGAGIEVWVNEALTRAFAADRELTVEDLLATAKDIPASKGAESGVHKWALENGVIEASINHTPKTEVKGRKLAAEADPSNS